MNIGEKEFVATQHKEFKVIFHKLPETAVIYSDAMLTI
jgi:hypothetical protein